MQNFTNDFEVNEDTKMKDLVNIYNDFTGSFNTELFNDGIVNEIDETTLQRYLANPDKYQKELESLSMYYYISNGDIFQLLEMPRILPTLNYSINSDDNSKQYEKNLKKCNDILRRTKHKTLTRDLISQVITAGTLTAVWLGEKDNFYLYVFDSLEFIFPSYRRNGDWVIWMDLNYLDNMSELNRKIFCDSLYPCLSLDLYEKYKKSNDTKDRYIELPQERSVVLRTRTLKRNQRFGIPWSSSSFKSISHKKKLKDMEKNVSNKVMNAIAILQLGNKENSNVSLGKGLKQKVYTGVKDGMDKNTKSALSVIGIPDWASIEMLDIKNGDIALNPKKYEGINSDISISTGLSQALLNGTGSNYASTKLNLDIFYKRIAILLEDIESEVYSKLFNLLLPNGVKDQYFMVYDKEMPLTLKEKIESLSKLHFQEGMSLKAVIDLIDGVDFSTYIKDTLYEQDVMKLKEKIKPFQSAYTSTGDNSESDDNGRPSIDDGDLENESTIRNKGSDGNSNPE